MKKRFVIFRIALTQDKVYATFESEADAVLYSRNLVRLFPHYPCTIWVKDSTELDDSAEVGDSTRVYKEAIVGDTARIYKEAIVGDSAVVFEKVRHYTFRLKKEE